VTTSERIVATHVRAACFVMLERITPGNEGRGYVLRRLIRRATLHARRLNMKSQLGVLVDEVVNVVGAALSGAPRAAGRDSRRHRFRGRSGFSATSNRECKLFERIASKHPQSIPGAEAFKLHDTFGGSNRPDAPSSRESAASRSTTRDSRRRLAAQRERSKGAITKHLAEAKDLPKSEFTGYERAHHREQGHCPAQGRQSR